MRNVTIMVAMVCLAFAAGLNLRGRADAQDNGNPWVTVGGWQVTDIEGVEYELLCNEAFDRIAGAGEFALYIRNQTDQPLHVWYHFSNESLTPSGDMTIPPGGEKGGSASGAWTQTSSCSAVPGVTVGIVSDSVSGADTSESEASNPNVIHVEGTLADANLIIEHINLLIGQLEQRLPVEPGLAGLLGGLIDSYDTYKQQVELLQDTLNHYLSGPTSDVLAALERQDSEVRTLSTEMTARESSISANIAQPGSTGLGSIDPLVDVRPAGQTSTEAVVNATVNGAIDIATMLNQWDQEAAAMHEQYAEADQGTTPIVYADSEQIDAQLSQIDMRETYVTGLNEPIPPGQDEDVYNNDVARFASVQACPGATFATQQNVRLSARCLAGRALELGSQGSFGQQAPAADAAKARLLLTAMRYATPREQQTLQLHATEALMESGWGASLDATSYSVFALNELKPLMDQIMARESLYPSSDIAFLLNRLHETCTHITDRNISWNQVPVCLASYRGW